MLSTRISSRCPVFVAASSKVSKFWSSTLSVTGAPLAGGCPAAASGTGITSSGVGEMIFRVTGPDGPRPSANPATGDFGSFGAPFGEGRLKQGDGEAHDERFRETAEREFHRNSLKNMSPQCDGAGTSGAAEDNSKNEAARRGVRGSGAPSPSGAANRRGSAPTRTSREGRSWTSFFAVRARNLAVEAHDEPVEIRGHPVGRRRRPRNGGIVVEAPESAHVPREDFVALAVIDGEVPPGGLGLLVESAGERNPAGQLSHRLLERHVAHRLRGRVQPEGTPAPPMSRTRAGPSAAPLRRRAPRTAMSKDAFGAPSIRSVTCAR